MRNEELQGLYSLPNPIRRMRWAGQLAYLEKRINTYGVFEGKPEGQRVLGRFTCMKEDNIKMK